MKIWKRLAALAIALTMSASLCVSAACVSDEGNGGNGQGNESTGGGNENTSGQGGGNTSGTGSGSSSNVVPIVTALKNQSLETVSIDLSATQNEKYVMQSTDEYYSVETRQEANLSVKANVADGNMDALTRTNSEYITYGSEDRVDGEKSASSLSNYTFVRNWHVFTYNAEDKGEVDDWSNISLYYEGNFSDYYDEYVGDYGETVPAISMDSVVGLITYLPRINIIFFNLAAAAKAVTVESGKAVIDVNKLVYNSLSELNGVLNDVTEETTASEFLKNKTISKYLSPIVNLMSAKQLEELILSNFAGSPYERIVNYVLKILVSTEGLTAYEYLVKIVENAELLIRLGNFGLFEGFERPVEGVDNLTVGYIIQTVFNLLGYSFPEEEVHDYLEIARTYSATLLKASTQSEFKIEIPEYDNAKITAKGLKMEYVLNTDYTIASQTFAGDITIETGYSDDEYRWEESIKISASGYIEYVNQEVALTDIDDCAVYGYGYGQIADGTYQDLTTLCLYLGESEEYETSVNVSITVEGGKVKEFSAVIGEDGTIRAEEDTVIIEYGEYTIEISAKLRQYSAFGSLGIVYLNFYYTYNGYKYYVDSIRIEGEYGHYTNTVAGVVNGTGWTFANPID